METTIHLIRCLSSTGTGKIWICCNRRNKLVGTPDMTSRQVTDKFQELFGKHEEVLRYRGVMRSSEAAITVGGIMGNC